MAYLKAVDLAKAYGAHDLFAGLSFSIQAGDRLALIGPNGAGKSTLLRILAGEEVPDRGRVDRAAGVRVGFLPQQTLLAVEAGRRRQGLVWDYCLQAFAHLVEMEARLKRLERSMAEDQKALEDYGVLQAAFERLGGYDFHARIRRVMRGLGVPEEAFMRPLRELSGGERRRVALARLLLEAPDLLLLDEPTNHLDFAAVEWLEDWLAKRRGACVMVSHDRRFLDRSSTKVWELAGGRLEVNRGNYSAYLEQRRRRQESQWARHLAQERRIRKEEEFIRRNIAGQKSRQAKGRRKRLERLKAQERVEAPRREEKGMGVRFEAGKRGGDLVLETRDLQVGYRSMARALFRVPDLVLRRGERVAILGPNGSGKSALLKTILGLIPPYAGSVRLGAGLQVGYFAQGQEDLPLEETPLGALAEWAPGLGREAHLSLLARFSLTGDLAETPIGRLSGGERERLALLRLTLLKANVLLLDEPTNHLDIPAQEALQEALQAFQGTLLLVSHDRFLIDAVADGLWAILAESRSLEVLEGGYERYRQRVMRAGAKRAAERRAAGRRPGPRARRPKPADLQALERRVLEFEAKLQALERELQQVGEDYRRARELGERWEACNRALQQALGEWETAARHVDHGP
jgi:ATP-binding cassette subfamily F protein 3